MPEDPTHPAFIALVLLSLGGVVLALVLNRRLHAGRELSRRASTPIAQATAGARAKLVGQVDPAGELLRAPLTGRPCIAWRVVIWKRDVARGGVFSDLTESRGFYLRDTTGTVFVEGWSPDSPSSVSFMNRPSHRLAPEDSVSSLPPAVLAYLDRYCAQLRDMYLGDVQSGRPVTAVVGTTLECAEDIIEPCDTVAVVGELRPPAAQGQPPVFAGERRALSAESEHLS